MFNRGRTGHDRRNDAVTGDSVNRQLLPMHARFIGKCAQFLRCEILQAAERSVRQAVVASIDIDLDPVSAIRDFLPNCTPRFRYTRDFDEPLWRF